MAFFESIFDITYLTLVLGLGLRLVREEDPTARLFGTMSILLGAGDAFHLIPRIMAHFTPDGFTAYAAALSWGQFVTSITMTIFYVIYYIYYRRLTGIDRPGRNAVVAGLAILRVLLVLMPQNDWGTLPGDYAFGILRNIPFAILGILLIFWSGQSRRVPGLKNMGLLIFLSFLFYVPVVLWSNVFPIIGALMMPKTVAYLLIVFTGFRHFLPRQKDDPLCTSA